MRAVIFVGEVPAPSRAERAYAQVILEAGTGRNGAKEEVLDFLIMENVFYGKEIARIYDLKGSERDRYVSQALASEGRCRL